MKNRGNLYVVGFTLAVCVACSLVVSGAVTILKERQERNIRLDRQKNVLLSLDLLANGKKPKAAEIESIFASRIEGIVVNLEGEAVADKKPGQLTDKDKNLLAVYVSKNGGVVEGYAIPVQGKGLWSTIYGFLALEADGVTVKGIAFYQHGETPGLGGEIEKDWFRDNFKGKKILNDAGELVSIKVVKGKAVDAVPAEKLPHYVDGISGATMTSKGVTEFLEKDLRLYEPFFKRIRAKV